MERKVCAAASCRVLHERQASRCSGSGCEPIRRLSWGEALILVVLLSLGLWALIWGRSRCWLRNPTPAVMRHAVLRREAIIRCQIRETVAWTSAAKPRGMGGVRPIPARRAAMHAANLHDLNCTPREPKHTAGFLEEFATLRDKTTLPTHAESAEPRDRGRWATRQAASAAGLPQLLKAATRQQREGSIGRHQEALPPRAAAGFAPLAMPFADRRRATALVGLSN
jgi:hypothetical protein